MTILEQYLAEEVSYEDAVTQLVRERADALHIATSGMGVDPAGTAKRRISAYRLADNLHQQLKKIWFMGSTPPAFPETLNSHRLQASHKGVALYLTPERFEADKVSHTPLTPDEKFARENKELLNLDLKMARIEALGLFSSVGE